MQLLSLMVLASLLTAAGGDRLAMSFRDLRLGACAPGRDPKCAYLTVTVDVTLKRAARPPSCTSALANSRCESVVRAVVVGGGVSVSLAGSGISPITSVSESINGSCVHVTFCGACKHMEVSADTVSARLSVVCLGEENGLLRVVGNTSLRDNNKILEVLTVGTCLQSVSVGLIANSRAMDVVGIIQDSGQTSAFPLGAAPCHSCQLQRVQALLGSGSGAGSGAGSGSGSGSGLGPYDDEDYAYAYDVDDGDCVDSEVPTTPAPTSAPKEPEDEGSPPTFVLVALGLLPVCLALLWFYHLGDECPAFFIGALNAALVLTVTIWLYNTATA